MKAPLCRHPKIIFHGQSALPTQPPGGVAVGQSIPRGAGILKGATIFRTGGYGGLQDHLKLQIEHEGRIQVAELWLNDSNSLEPLRAFLDRHKDSSLEELGSLEIDL
jgi:hypothetical protein